MFRSLFGQRRRRQRAHTLYVALSEQGRRPEFYSVAGVADTPDGRFDMLALHIFLVLHRLKGRGREAEAMSREILDVLVDDLDRNLREAGVSDIKIGKRVRELAEAVHGRITGYDLALEEAGAALERALERNVYRGAPPPESAALLAAYVEAAAADLEDQETADLLDGTVRFAGLPSAA